jgi:hypothetical protein
MAGVKDYRGLSLETLGVRSYRMAADILSILANERDLRELFQRNQMRSLPIEEEVAFLRQCAARFNLPRGVAVDSAGNVYVADTENRTIRKVTPAGVSTTLAGLAGSLPGSADGTGSIARFSNPSGVAVDSAGNVYVADTGNNTIRKGYPAPRILNSGPGFGFNGGQFGFNLTGPAGQLVVVEASTDLVSWLPIGTNTPNFVFL